MQRSNMFVAVCTAQTNCPVNSKPIMIFHRRQHSSAAKNTMENLNLILNIYAHSKLHP